MKYKSYLVEEDGKTRKTSRKSRKMGGERIKIFLYNKKLSAVLRKERQAARDAALEAASTENENQESN